MLSCGVGLGVTKGRGLGPWHKKRPNTGYKLLWPVLYLEKRVGVVPGNLVWCPYRAHRLVPKCLLALC